MIASRLHAATASAKQASIRKIASVIVGNIVRNTRNLPALLVAIQLKGVLIPEAAQCQVRAAEMAHATAMKTGTVAQRTAALKGLSAATGNAT